MAVGRRPKRPSPLHFGGIPALGTGSNHPGGITALSAGSRSGATNTPGTGGYGRASTPGGCQQRTFRQRTPTLAATPRRGRIRIQPLQPGVVGPGGAGPRPRAKG